MNKKFFPGQVGIGVGRCMTKFLNMVGNDLLPSTSDGSQIPP